MDKFFDIFQLAGLGEPLAPGTIVAREYGILAVMGMGVRHAADPG